MQQRVVSGLQWMMSLTAGVMAAAVLWQQSQMIQEMRMARADEVAQRQALLAALGQLHASPLPGGSSMAGAVPARNDPPAYYPSDSQFDGMSLPPDPGSPSMRPSRGSTRPAVPPSLTLKFVEERKDGPPVEPKSVSVADAGGKVIHAEPVMRRQSVPASYHLTDGTVKEDTVEVEVPARMSQFAVLEPGRYELSVTLQDGQQCTRPILIRTNDPQEQTIICPAPREKIPVTIAHSALPDDLVKAKCRVSCQIIQKPVTVGDDFEWTSQVTNNWEIEFDPATGEPISLLEYAMKDDRWDKLKFDLRKTAPQDRVVFLPTGPVGIRSKLTFPDGTLSRSMPVSDTIDFPEDYEVQVVDRGKEELNRRVPDEILRHARASLQLAMTQKPGVRPVQDVAEEPTPAETAKPLLTVISRYEKEDGSPARNVSITLTDSNGTVYCPRAVFVPDSRSKPDNGTCVFDSLEPERYTMAIRLPDGQHCERSVVIRDDKPQELVILCPLPRKKIPVLVTIKPLEKLRGKEFSIDGNFYAGTIELGQCRWIPENEGHQRIAFDVQTGQALVLQGERGFVDLEKAPAEDRVVFLPAGPIRFEFEARVPENRSTTSIYKYPQDDGVPLKHVLKPEDTRWELEIPEGLLKQIPETKSPEGP